MHLDNQRVSRKKGINEMINPRNDTIWEKIVFVEMDKHAWIGALFWRQCH